MNLNEIKQAIASGKRVYWASTNYEVIKDSIGQYLIHSKFNDNYIGLIHMDGITLNGREEQFFTDKDVQNKKAVVLNYGLMMSDLEQVMREKSDWIGQFMRDDTVLRDDDIQLIATKFHTMLVEFKKLNDTIETIAAKTL